MIEALAPDLVLIDLEAGRRQHPGPQAGWELLEALAHTATTRAIPVVISSIDQELLNIAMDDPTRYGGQTHVIKPLDIDALVATVQTLIGVA
jgi:CheY-like chemotaxis protein